MAQAGGGGVSARVQCAVYGLGMFSTTMHFMAMTIVPLWVVRLDLSPFWLGVVLGCRPVLALFLSIHTGVLMDRMGGRRVMLFFAALALAMPLLYPALPWVWAIVALQMLWGLADSTGWLGAQALVGQAMGGRTVYAGRLSFISRFGNVMGPPLVGAAWDAWGPWGGFGLASAWGLGAVVCALLLPASSGIAPRPEGEGESGRPRRGLGSLLPDFSDYIDAFRLLALPTVAVTVAIGMMTHVGNNIQGTFYIVWLNQVGIPGTLIGTLISISSLAAGFGSLMGAPLARRFPPYWLLWLVVWVAIVLICITPLLGTFVVFAVVLSLRAAISGIHQPLVISLMLRTAGAGAQGRAIGLRATANRVTSIGAPVLMGGIAEVIGIEASFYVIGALATVAMIAIAGWISRHPEIHRAAREV